MLNRLLITGAAGRVAGLVMPHLSDVARSFRMSDLRPPDVLPDGAEFVACDLADGAAVLDLLQDCDGVLHLGGIAQEDRFESILSANVVGMHNLYEAARLNGRPRIIFASSNHVVGYYQQHQRLDASARPRPDSWYGVSKVFGEAVAEFYFRKFGVETAIVRVGSCFEEPVDRRMLSTWFSAADFGRLVARVFCVHRVGCPVIYGVSDNDGAWWDNASTGYLGWSPQDSSRVFADRFESEVLDKEDARAVYQGGVFTELPIIGGRS